MEFSNIDPSTSEAVNRDVESSYKKENDPCKAYEKEQISNFANFMLSKGFKAKASLSSEELNQAERMESGVSGASKLMHEGSEKIIKPQVLTNVFSKNLLTLSSQNGKVSHASVSESDDSFAHFPRKELLGYRIARLFNLDVPCTELLKVEGARYASSQVYLKDAVAMVGIENLQPYQVDFESVANTFLFHIFSENIDGHTGNILFTERKDEDGDKEYVVIPIDYGLIFPRHDSIYPGEFNLVKKGFFHFFKTKNINIQKYVHPILENLEKGLTPDLQQIMTPQEEVLFRRNRSALQKMKEFPEESLSLERFFDTFIEKVILEKS